MYRQRGKELDRRDDIPATYSNLVIHRRFFLALLFAGVGLVALVACWIGVSGTTIVANQLSYIASGGLIGLFLLGLAALAYWGEQRQREMERLGDMEAYLAAIAGALGLIEGEQPSPALDPMAVRTATHLEP